MNETSFDKQRKETKIKGKGKREYEEEMPEVYFAGNSVIKKTPNKKPRNPDAIMKAAELLKD
tara:strand:+ start:866 stop:1051 length:186 start_codon:yes stop_codon:yes gene_type:complete